MERKRVVLEARLIPTSALDGFQVGNGPSS